MKKERRFLFKRRKTKDENNACTRKLLSSILICWNGLSVSSTKRYVSIAEQRTTVAMWATKLKLRTMRVILAMLICVRPPLSIFLPSCKAVERPKIWEGNKRMKNMFHLYNMECGGITISFVTYTCLRYLQNLPETRLGSLFVQDCCFCCVYFYTYYIKK